MVYEVWAAPPEKDFELVEVYPPSQWQLAEKLKQFLIDEGCKVMVIMKD